jgi:two-component system, response regulator
VEDDANLEELATLILQKEEYTRKVVLARDGMEAIEYLFSPRRSTIDMPCLVLLDLNIPRLDGFGVLERIRKEDSTRFIPVVVLTSSSRPADVPMAYHLGASGFLDKVPENVAWPEMMQTVARYWRAINVPISYSPLGLGEGSDRRAEVEAMFSERAPGTEPSI